MNEPDPATFAATHVTVPSALDGERLDRVVSLLTGLTRAKAASLISSSAIVVNGRAVTSKSARVSTDDDLSMQIPIDESAPAIEPDPSVMVPVVFADRDIIVVNKPKGMVVHPGAGNRDATMVHGLLAQFPDLAQLAAGRAISPMSARDEGLDPSDPSDPDGLADPDGLPDGLADPDEAKEFHRSHSCSVNRPSSANSK